MTLIRPREIREMDLETRVSKLKELRADLMHERGVAAMGGAPPSPGKIRALRKSINRLITIMKEEEKIARGEKKVPKEAAK
jgi:large subunit ribosomal protein L29